MDHYGTSAWKVIQENLFPTKTARQVRLVVLLVFGMFTLDIYYTTATAQSEKPML